MHPMNARPRLEISPKILERTVRKVFEAEVAARAEVKRIEQLRKTGKRFKEKGFVYAKKLTSAHTELGAVLMHHVGQTVDTVRMFGDLFRDHQADVSQVVPNVMSILTEDAPKLLAE